MKEWREREQEGETELKKINAENGEGRGERGREKQAIEK